MTNAQLVEELQKLPGYLPVKVVLSEVYLIHNDSMERLCKDDAIEADTVRHEGQFILIESK